MYSGEGPSTAITAERRGPYSSTSARMPRRFPSPSSPTSPDKTMVFSVRMRDSKSARASPATAARPAPLSEMPGAVRRPRSCFTCTSVPAGKTVSRCATNKMTPLASDPERSAMTFPAWSVRASRPLAANSDFRASPRRASSNSGAAISVRRICCSVTQSAFLSIQESPRKEPGSWASLEIESSVARAESAAIQITIPQMRTGFTRIMRRVSSPIVEDVGTATIVAGGSVARLHGDALRFHAKSAVEQGLKGFAPREIHAGRDLLRSRCCRECCDSIEQALEAYGCASAGAHRGEFDVADTGTSFAPRADVAYGESSQFRIVPYEHGIAEMLFRHGANLALHVEPFEIRVGNLAAGGEEAGKFAGFDFGKKAGFGIRSLRRRPDIFRHVGHQIARPKSELLIEQHVFRTTGKGIQAEMPVAP